MPARKIPNNYRSMTGKTATRDDAGNAHYESTLERDLYLRLRFDPTVVRFDPQPVIIEYLNDKGKPASYTPDTFIEYVPGTLDARGQPRLNTFVEVKYLEELHAKAAEFAPKFRAAAAFARERGCLFRVLTEAQIRTPMLENARFLWDYDNLVCDHCDQNLLITRIGEFGSVTPADLLASLYDTLRFRAEILPVLWYLVARRRVLVDLERPLTMISPLSLPVEHQVLV